MLDALRIYDYLILARDRVFDAVRPLDSSAWNRRFDFGLGTIASTLTHLMISEWYYLERLHGCEVPPYSTWPIRYDDPPVFAVVERTWRQQQAAVRETIAAEQDWTRPISWPSFPDDAGRRFRIDVSPSDLISQLVLHEMHHRAQLMVMMRQLGHPLADLDFNALMFKRTPATA
jgi:uncharacterized damage-inducible protein DinB